MSIRQDLTANEIKRIFSNRFYHQLQNPEDADFIFIGLDANRPSYSEFGLVDSERAFLQNGVNWCKANKFHHPILSKDLRHYAPALRYWKRAEQVLPLSAIKRISMVELRRWPTENKGSCTIDELTTDDNKEHLLGLARLMEAEQKQFFVSPSVLDRIQHRELIDIFPKVFRDKKKVMEARFSRPRRIEDSNIHVIGHFSSRDSREAIGKTVSYVQELIYK